MKLCIFLWDERSVALFGTYVHVKGAKDAALFHASLDHDFESSFDRTFVFTFVSCTRTL